MIDQLFAADVISSDQYGELNNEIDRVSKTRRLTIMMHASKHPAAFVIFRQALYELKDYRSLAEEIDQQYYCLSNQPTVTSNNAMSPQLNLPTSGFQTEDPANGAASSTRSTAETGTVALVTPSTLQVLFWTITATSVVTILTPVRFHLIIPDHSAITAPAFVLMFGNFIGLSGHC